MALARHNLLEDRKLIAIVAIFVFAPVAYFLVLPYFTAVNPDIRMVSGTEYISGEYGQIIVRIGDKFGNAYAGASCKASVLYPDKSYFLLDTEMNESSVPGNYYYPFMTPSTTGIYEEHITCTVPYKGSTQELLISSSFHVSVALNYVVEMSKLQDARYLEMVRRMNNMTDQMGGISDEVKATHGELNTTIQTLNSSVGELQKRMDDGNSELESAINRKFEGFYDKMADSFGMMQGVFSNKS